MKYIYIFLGTFFGILFGNIATLLLLTWFVWMYITVNMGK